VEYSRNAEVITSWHDLLSHRLIGPTFFEESDHETMSQNA